MAPAIEIALGLTFGGIEYWVRNHPPRVGLSTWADRFSTTEWWILDEDPVYFNYLNHALSAAGYHLAARTNDLGFFESVTYNAAASLVWEYVVEYNRKIDFNDLIFTTPAGLALGEFGHALGRLLQEQPSGFGWGVARWTLGFPQSFNDAARRLDDPRGPEVAHRFRVSAGAARAAAATTRGGAVSRESRPIARARVRGRLARMSDRVPAGTRWRGFADGNFTALDASLTADSDGDYGIDLWSDTFVAGWRYTDIAEGRVEGRATNLGTAIAWTYRSEQLGSWRDRLGMAHLPGLAADAALWGPRWRFEGSARIHPDYGGIGALSDRVWAAENPGEVGWSSLSEEGYYHAFGASTRLRAEMTLAYASAGAELFAGGYRTHRGRDLFEEALTFKQRVASLFVDYDLWLRGAIAGDWFAEARLEGRRRWESFEELDASARILRAGAAVGAEF